VSLDERANADAGADEAKTTTTTSSGDVVAARIVGEVEHNPPSTSADAIARDAEPEPLPPPPTSAAMTLEQYRAYVASQAHAKGTIHATPPEEKQEQQSKVKHGWWPCQSYKCDGRLNPKVAEKCEACGALKRLGPAGGPSGATFNARMTTSQYDWNQTKRR
jgi:hypothetical protein